MSQSDTRSGASPAAGLSLHLLGPSGSAPAPLLPVPAPGPRLRLLPAARRLLPPAARPSSAGEGPLTPADLGRKCLEFRFRFREWTVIFFFFLTSRPTFLTASTREVLRPLPRIKSPLPRWLLRLRSPRPPRNLRRPNPRPPERRMTLSWENSVELWREGKRRKKVKSSQKLQARSQQGGRRLGLLCSLKK